MYSCSIPKTMGFFCHITGNTNGTVVPEVSFGLLLSKYFVFHPRQAGRGRQRQNMTKKTTPEEGLRSGNSFPSTSVLLQLSMPSSVDTHPSLSAGKFFPLFFGIIKKQAGGSIKCPISLICSTSSSYQKQFQIFYRQGLHKKKTHTFYRNDNHSQSGLNLLMYWHFLYHKQCDKKLKNACHHVGTETHLS